MIWNLVFFLEGEGPALGIKYQESVCSALCHMTPHMFWGVVTRVLGLHGPSGLMGSLAVTPLQGDRRAFVSGCFINILLANPPYLALIDSQF